MLFHQVLPAERSHFQPRIAALEQSATYPIGEDFFQLDHGADYFAFFDRLGDVKYYVALDDKNSDRPQDRLHYPVVAVDAWVLRQVPNHSGAIPEAAWYLCDFKVHPDYQRQILSLRLLRYAIAQNKQTCDRGYAISMNSGNDRTNRLMQVFCRFPNLRFRHSATVGIYSLSCESMQSISPLLQKYRGPLSYLSLEGIKDLRLQSNGQILPLLHVQWNTANHPLSSLPTPTIPTPIIPTPIIQTPIIQTSTPSPLPGYTHMFCVPETDELTHILTQRGLQPGAIASVISHGMDNNDWRFILTSDI